MSFKVGELQAMHDLNNAKYDQWKDQVVGESLLLLRAAKALAGTYKGFHEYHLHLQAFVGQIKNLIEVREEQRRRKILRHVQTVFSSEKAFAEPKDVETVCFHTYMKKEKSMRNFRGEENVLVCPGCRMIETAR